MIYNWQALKIVKLYLDIFYGGGGYKGEHPLEKAN